MPSWHHHESGCVKRWPLGFASFAHRVDPEGFINTEIKFLMRRPEVS